MPSKNACLPYEVRLEKNRKRRRLNKKEAVVLEIFHLCAEIGWQVAVPSGASTWQGIMLGDPEFLSAIASVGFPSSWSVFEPQEVS